MPTADLTYEECRSTVGFSEDWDACQPPTPGAPPAPGDPAAPAPPPVLDPRPVADQARANLTFAIPTPHTSPPEDGFQLVGLNTWYWLDAADWTSHTVRAEIPLLWVEVTATPQTVTWTPGDGSSPVTCDGPARSHPGTTGATTDCGHTYIDIGSYTVTVAVTYTIDWAASTGETGTLAPITLTTDLPIDVQQRQVVIDGA